MENGEAAWGMGRQLKTPAMSGSHEEEHCGDGLGGDGPGAPKLGPADRDRHCQDYQAGAWTRGGGSRPGEAEAAVEM